MQEEDEKVGQRRGGGEVEKKAWPRFIFGSREKIAIEAQASKLSRVVISSLAALTPVSQFKIVLCLCFPPQGVTSTPILRPFPPCLPVFV